MDYTLNEQFTFDEASSERAETPIVAIWATCYPPQPLSKSSGLNRPETNHWTLSFAYSKNESVRINPNPTKDGFDPGNEQVLFCTFEHKPYEYTNQAVILRRIATQDLTISSFVALIKANGFHRYKFTEGRQGCRYWIKETLKMLHRAGKFQMDSEFVVVKALMNKTWEKDGVTLNNRGIKVLKGKFLAEGEWAAISPFRESGSPSAEVADQKTVASTLEADGLEDKALDDPRVGVSAPEGNGFAGDKLD